MCGADDLLHVAAGSLPFVSTQRTIVEDLGRRARDRVEAVALASERNSANDTSSFVAPLRISIGLNACTCIDGVRRFTASTTSR